MPWENGAGTTPASFPCRGRMGQALHQPRSHVMGEWGRHYTSLVPTPWENGAGATPASFPHHGRMGQALYQPRSHAVGEQGKHYTSLVSTSWENGAGTTPASFLTYPAVSLEIQLLITINTVSPNHSHARQLTM